MIEFQFFPRSCGITPQIKSVIDCFVAVEKEIDSQNTRLVSNEVLKKVCPYLEKIDFYVETSKREGDRIDVPVLFGRDNSIDKAFRADALSKDGKVVIEVEAGRATENNQYLKDIFEASMMFDVEYLILVVRKFYRTHKDFDIIYTTLETMYISNRIKLPLKGILLIGY